MDSRTVNADVNTKRATVKQEMCVINKQHDTQPREERTSPRLDFWLHNQSMSVVNEDEPQMTWPKTGLLFLVDFISQAGWTNLVCRNRSQFSKNLCYLLWR